MAIVTEIGPIEVRDVTGQKGLKIKSVPSDATINEVVRNLIGEMDLLSTDAEGRPLNYHARLERESRQLGDNERVGDALRPSDSIRLLPTVDAGGAA